MVKMLLEAGASFTATLIRPNQSYKYTTALHISTMVGSVEISRLILGHYRPNPDVIDSHGWTSLMMACHADAWDLVKFLVERGADVDIKLDGVSTLFFDACVNSRYFRARRLLKMGANPHVSFESLTPLHWCCLDYNHRQQEPSDAEDRLELMAILLITMQADVNAPDRFGKTPLMMACELRDA
ncbi:ankyrin repeat-containing domain protein [Hypoxylon sp. FL1284]|nr:ankyrin repeat-containing domain protein [Hypoxylon sp. FL1284]